ncbi:MAG TPA: hypothetical protein GXX29_13830 [Firmicutes bacterium]|nr:hypothetical protein [Bacillota bacterium]
MKMKADRHTVLVGGKRLELSRLNKVLWPEAGLTKADLIAYYWQIAPRLLPHLYKRPLTLTRYPDGIEEGMFYQKDTPSYAPDWLKTYRVVSDDSREIRYLLAEDEATLVWLANQAAIELHPWMSTTDHPDYPSYAVVDLDPATGAEFGDVVEIAGLVRVLLQELGLKGYPKLSGASGIHIYIPLWPRYPYRLTSRFVGYLGELIVKAYPQKATNERLVAKRDGKVYIDHLQNLPGKTIVAPYVPRPLPHAPVSVPVEWEELIVTGSGRGVQPHDFTLADIKVILARPPLFEQMYQAPQSLDKIMPLFAAGEKEGQKVH